MNKIAPINVTAGGSDKSPHRSPAFLPRKGTLGRRVSTSFTAIDVMEDNFCLEAGAYMCVQMSH